jgi:L-arabinokinase
VLFQSHAAYAECGLGAAACDQLVELAREFGFAGAKMTGGGAGGVVVLIGTSDQHDAFHQLVTVYTELRGETPHVFEGSSPGAMGPGGLARAPQLLGAGH